MTPLGPRVSGAARQAGGELLQRMQPRRGGRVLFSSFDGQYSDNPRAISEALARRRPDRPQSWIAADPRTVRAAGAAVVPPHGLRYQREAGRSRYVVSNTMLPQSFRKGRGMTYVQTWHGTPLKRLAYDVDRWRRDAGAVRRFERDKAAWDVLLSPSRFATDVFRDAFRFDGDIIETGYPRNDALSAPDREATRAAVRRELGIADDTLAILYAPTWRDTLVDASGTHGFALALDPAELRARLPRPSTLLLRLHYMVAAQLADQHGEDVINVSRFPDIRELYLAADVLVTDYSSVMFDFAVTGKPMIFFAYDLEEYRDDVRGFYFELEPAAPGPVCATTAEVADALAGLDAARRAHADRYAAFRRRFCPLEDGHAAQRVVDQLLSG